MFDLLDISDLASIDWKRRPVIKKQFETVSKLIKLVEGLLDEDLRQNESLSLTNVSKQPDSCESNKLNDIPSE